jgi:uncharacterized protein YtpQ (UPF0354 family)
MGWREWLGLEITPARFAQKFVTVMQDADPALKLVLDLENFRVLKGEGDYINLHNAYHAYRQAPRKQRQQAVVQFVHSILNAPVQPVTFEAVRQMLLPALRRKSLLEHFRLTVAADQREASAFAHREFGADAILVLAIDAEQSMSIVMESSLEQWGVTFEQALAAAMDNLRDHSADNFLPVEGAPALVQGNWCDAYDSSRILLPDLMFRGVASGNPVIMVPTRETLLLAPDHQPAAQLAMLAAAGQAFSNSSRWGSTAMYQVVEGKIVPYTPSDGDVHEAQRVLEREVAMSDYTDQKQQLDKIHERDGVDVFVASYGNMEKDGRLQSFCSWTDDVEAMLPKTDVVALARNGQDEQFEMVLVDWETLQARNGDLLQELPNFPPRYRVSAFPTALFEELLAVKQRAAAQD